VTIKRSGNGGIWTPVNIKAFSWRTDGEVAVGGAFQLIYGAAGAVGD